MMNITIFKKNIKKEKQKFLLLYLVKMKKITLLLSKKSQKPKRI